VRKLILCVLFLVAALALQPGQSSAGRLDPPAPPWIEIEPWNVGPDPADPFCSPYLCLQVAVGAQAATDAKTETHMITCRYWDQNNGKWATPERYKYNGDKHATSNFYFAGKDVVSAGTWRVYVHKESTWGKAILAGNTGVYAEVELYEHAADNFSAAWDSMTGIWPQGDCAPRNNGESVRPRGWRTLFSGPRRHAAAPAPSR
jgi:hypothetical protein